MLLQRIVYTNDEGNVSVVVPSPQYKGTIDDLAKKVIPDGVEHYIVEVGDIPSDRTFRNAWEHNAGAITTNMEKARNIKREQLRVERAELFVPLDRDFNIALEQKDTVKQDEIAAKRQKLRDVTVHPLIEAAKTPQALKNLKIDVTTLDLVDTSVERKRIGRQR